MGRSAALIQRLGPESRPAEVMAMSAQQQSYLGAHTHTRRGETRAVGTLRAIGTDALGPARSDDTDNTGRRTLLGCHQPS